METVFKIFSSTKPVHLPLLVTKKYLSAASLLFFINLVYPCGSLLTFIDVSADVIDCSGYSHKPVSERVPLSANSLPSSYASSAI